ncbi:MAG: phosphoribosyltransferase family protein, partial [Desulfobacula sp.]|nr:phosphoribosyltransferase family protein [Desulfobacula sp.]
RHLVTSQIDLIMPVPMHKKKLRERGFNQAFLLIRNFVRLYQQIFEEPPSWKIDTISLARIKMTQPQTGFDIDQRKANLKNAFKVINQKAIDNKHILLIDDVFTTGSTCNEAARVLLKYGAKKVDALVLARA